MVWRGLSNAKMLVTGLLPNGYDRVSFDGVRATVRGNA